MSIQYKLFKIDQDDFETTILKLSEYRYIVINDSVIAIEYDYMKNSYKELLDSMSTLSVMQYIITTSICYNILKVFVKNEVTIMEIHLNSLFDEDNEFIAKCIKNINNDMGRDFNLKELLELLKWYNYDEGIDIDYMSFCIKSNGRKCTFDIYNNGIVAIDVDDIRDDVIKLLEKVV